jgi:hypothetical protein
VSGRGTVNEKNEGGADPMNVRARTAILIGQTAEKIAASILQI